MSALDHNLYSMLISALVGKAEGYGATKGYNHTFPYYHVFDTTPKSGSGNSYNYNYNYYYYDQSDNPEAIFLRTNNECDLGLLAEPPIYYNGDDQITIGSTTYTNQYPKIIISGQTESSTFLEVKEIPGGDLGNYFADVDTAEPRTDRYFNGLYWSSYSRLRLYKRVPPLSVIKTTGTTGQQKWERFDVTADDKSKDELTYKSKLIKNDTINDYEFSIYITNDSAIYMGENLNTKAWPNVTCFGLFTTLVQSTRLIDTSIGKLLTDENLYYWGQFEESNKWYHPTEDTSKQSGKTYYTYDEATDTYTLFTGSSFVTGVTYYEKTGIIVQPAQGGVFSKDQFQLRWNSDIISNEFSR